MSPVDADLTLPDGRTLGYVDHGSAADTAVLWCHGGPGSRLEPQALAPMIVLHGSADSIVPVEQAHYTAKLVPGAKLRIADGLGHFSIMGEILGALRALPAR